MFSLNANRQLDAIKQVCQRSQAGVFKRIDENRELLELLQNEAPALLAKCPWIEAGSQARTNSCPTWPTSQKLRRLFVARHTRGVGRGILHSDLPIAPKSFSTPLLGAFEESRNRKNTARKRTAPAGTGNCERTIEFDTRQ